MQRQLSKTKPPAGVMIQQKETVLKFRTASWKGLGFRAYSQAGTNPHPSQPDANSTKS